MGLSQAAFALRLNTKQPAVSEWEHAGDNYRFVMATLEKIAKEGGVPVSVFFRDDEAGLQISEISYLREQAQQVGSVLAEMLSVLDRALGIEPSPAAMTRVGGKLSVATKWANRRKRTPGTNEIGKESRDETDKNGPR